MNLILAFDIGTSSLRTALFTETGERIVPTTAQQTYPLHTTPDGAAELAPILLREAALGCLRTTLAALRTDPALAGSQIIGIGTSCFWHSLVGLGKGANAITPIITWADSRCRPDAANLRMEFGEREYHAGTGCMLRASFWPAKLLWLRRTKPTLFSRVRTWVSPAEWLQRLFCGEANCALGMATGTGLFNPSTLGWAADVLDYCGIQREQLGPLSDLPSTLSPKLTKEFPELACVPWFPGIGDGAASNLGSGATRPGLAAINVGTSAALRVMRKGVKARAPFGLFCYRVDAERYLIGGAVSNAGNLRNWCLREWQLPTDAAQIERELLQRQTPDHGLTVLPFWTAERAPTWRDDLRGAILGFTQNTTAMDILQATTEAVYQQIARIGEMLEEHEGARPKYIVSGGIQKSPASIQRLANVLNAPLHVNNEAEASLRGAAIYVAERTGVRIPPFHDSTPPTRPRRLPAALYKEQREAQTRLEGLLAE